MRWKTGRRSRNIQDRRGRRGFSRGGGSPIAIGGGGLGMVVVAIVITLLGGDPTVLLDAAAPVQSDRAPYNTSPIETSPEEDALADFVSVVLADTEDTWNSIFPREFGGRYQEPTLVLFTDVVQSACGTAQSAVGPFYCPADQQVYIDLSFYQDLKYKLGAPGDFAQAYVIAHEVGHHIQNLLGISKEVRAAQSRASQTQANQLSVRQELQADCLAGVWAYHTNQRGLLEAGDVEEALNAASQIGDDNLQRKQRGYVTPDSFTHGSAAQRVEWFSRGFTSGDVDQCDTFS
ncbi:neutral zinc metallopeptidase [Synechococcus sp. PCC 7335]|uniref:KPN_02809 family neutral zinc metallopeptidase n=1 Tax=Synechococcus sp. (strain ATCC 29403 / PCC 7335) TaxID=91464 RepID=UPI000571C901|nr:neutral zinc metallopeptidase [Synechococcus sp. PCC 7335]